MADFDMLDDAASRVRHEMTTETDLATVIQKMTALVKRSPPFKCTTADWGRDSDFPPLTTGNTAAVV
jgi:hypothetical protein